MSAFDIVSDFNLRGGLPSGAARRALDAEIAAEGGKVTGDKGERILLSNGDMVAYTPPPESPVIPDLSKVKSLRHYFGQRGYQPYPAWVYHKDGREKVLRDAGEAADLGIVYRKTTNDERNRFGVTTMWDWEDGCLWRPAPWVEPKFDPRAPGTGKTVIAAAIDQHKLQADMVASVAAAVAQVLRVTPGAAAPASVDPSQWEEFLAFQAWKKADEAVASVSNALVGGAEAFADDGEPSEPLTDEERAANLLTPEQDRALWAAEAERLGIKVDKRWGVDRLKSEIEQKQSAA